MQLELHCQKSVKRSLNSLHRDPNRIALKIGRPGFSIFQMLFVIKAFFSAKHVLSDKNKLGNHSLEKQK